MRAIESDLAELIVQLAGDTPSHILVPAIHRNRAEIREIFRSSKFGNIAGCLVRSGLIKRSAKARLIRDGAVLTETAQDILTELGWGETAPAAPLDLPPEQARVLAAACRFACPR